MKTNLKLLWYGVLLLCTQYLSAQKEEIWKETTVFEFNAPYETITINYDDEEFVFNVTEKTKFLLGKKQRISKERISIGSTVDVAIIIENRKRVLTKILLNKDEYGEVKKFEGVIESYKGDTAVIDGRKVALTDKTTIKCNGGTDCACSKGRSFLGFDELELGSFLTVYGEQNEDGVYRASKIEVCKNTHGKIDQEYMLNLSKDFDASNLNQFKKIPSNVFKAANGLHNGTIKLGNLEFKLLDDIRVQGYINMIGNRILPTYVKEDGFSEEHEVVFRFYVIENDVPNAAALPNGMIFIHTGLLRLMENEAQIATVLGHEIAHVTYEHGIRKYKTTRLTNSNLGKKTSKWLKKAFTKKMNIDEGTLVGKALNTALEHTTPETVMSLFNKKNETQSDRAGLYYMSEAGYDPREAANFWKIMMESTGNQKFMNKVFSSTLSMVNNIETDLDKTDYDALGEDGMNILVKSLLETVYTSHPLAIKRLGDINHLLSTTYKDVNFSQLDVGKESFYKHMGKFKE
ncbi:M48 family metalloprotease [Flavivirga spongiicola]|uniref:M48 family metalloprotease n=1 Tax=Flavivirga spongiicola TaxID=421621 RepID=A0ABU7XTZ6_9FLAO|nr:M48 family metalloprotease [Flavivirga sp. MEBiC05379]MDO5979254.1 M48 family metalloprotease [Flavivirga sp. MEBiC05379]